LKNSYCIMSSAQPHDGGSGSDSDSDIEIVGIQFGTPHTNDENKTSVPVSYLIQREEAKRRTERLEREVLGLQVVEPTPEELQACRCIGQPMQGYDPETIAQDTAWVYVNQQPVAFTQPEEIINPPAELVDGLTMFATQIAHTQLTQDDTSDPMQLRAATEEQVPIIASQVGCYTQQTLSASADAASTSPHGFPLAHSAEIPCSIADEPAVGVSSSGAGDHSIGPVVAAANGAGSHSHSHSQSRSFTATSSARTSSSASYAPELQVAGSAAVSHGVSLLTSQQSGASNGLSGFNMSAILSESDSDMEHSHGQHETSVSNNFTSEDVQMTQE
jgi:hypothetical protein